MKTLMILVAALLATLLTSATPLFSAENSLMNSLQLPKKDECLLFAKNCQDNAYIIQQRIERLAHEISRGATVYNDYELNILREKLDDANKALEFLYREGA
jgi:hypothetical protein